MLYDICVCYVVFDIFRFFDIWVLKVGVDKMLIGVLLCYILICMYLVIFIVGFIVFDVNGMDYFFI